MTDPKPSSESSPGLGVREELRTFFYPKENDIGALQRRDLFILGFQRFMSLPKEDPNSYIQLASVHGRPMSVGYGVDAPMTETEEPVDRDPLNPLIKMKYVDRDGDGLQFSSMGVAEFSYCKHGRPTFMTWHRPYLYLVEQAIRKAALYLVENGMLQGNQEAAKEQVQLLYLPYWNWALETTVPDVLLCESIELTQFSLYDQGFSSISSDSKMSGPHRTRIKNPFKSFKPTKEQYKYFNGEVPEPEKFDAPQGVPGTLTDYAQNCVFGPEGTLRQEGWHDYLRRFLVRDLRKNIVEGIMRNNFIAPDGKLSDSASHWMEAAHNSLHNSVSIALAPQYGMPPATTAPTKSNMTGTRKLNPAAVIVGRSAMINDMSTMDPAFWFHHCFVDCHLAMHRHAYPEGIYIPSSLSPPSNWDPDHYYPPKDPVPMDADLDGRSREWLLSAFHPWSKGLFPKIFPEYTADVNEERRKIRYRDHSCDVQYVNSQDVEKCDRWGYTYDLLLKPTDKHLAEVNPQDSNQWLTAQDAQAKFLFDYMDDPFYKVVHDAQKDFGLSEPLWKIKDLDQVPHELLLKLQSAAFTKKWRLTMVLPKFFKVDDGVGVGRSYTVNVYMLNPKDDKQNFHKSQKDHTFAGSASVFAPFNLRQCLNCQQNNTKWTVSVDLTEAVIAHGYTGNKDEEILERLVLDPIGVPEIKLQDPDKYKIEWQAKVKSEEEKQPSQDKNSIPYKLFEWKQILSEGNQLVSNQIPALAPKIFKETLSDIMHRTDFGSTMELMTKRHEPDYSFPVSQKNDGKK